MQKIDAIYEAAGKSDKIKEIKDEYEKLKKKLVPISKEDGKKDSRILALQQRIKTFAVLLPKNLLTVIRLPIPTNSKNWIPISIFCR